MNHLKNPKPGKLEPERKNKVGELRTVQNRGKVVDSGEFYAYRNVAHFDKKMGTSIGP